MIRRRRGTPTSPTTAAGEPSATTAAGVAELPAIAAHWPDPVVLVDVSGRIVQTNDAAEVLTGRPSREIVGRDVTDFVHADDRSVVRAELAAFIHSGDDTVRLEFRMVTGPEESRWVDCLTSNQLAVPAVGAVVLYIHDFTERKQAESDAARFAVGAREADRRYRIAFEATLVGMATVDVDGFYVDVNTALCTLLGQTPAAFVGQHLLDALHPEDGAMVGRVLGQLVTGTVRGSHQQEARYLRPDGETVVAEVALVPIYGDQHQVLSLMVFTQDVTARYEAASALETALERELEAAKRLRELDESKAKLLAAVSHDFRTPLTAIAGFAGLLAEAWDDYDEVHHRDFAMRILRNSGELERRLSEFLDVARYEHGAGTLHLIECDLQEIVQRVIDRCRFVLEHHVVTIASTSQSIISDPAAVARIVENLLTNAAKYAPRATTVHVAVEALAPTHVAVRVSDEGPGISPADRERVFEPFVRLGETVTAAPGTGIGLSSARELAERLGGTLGVEPAEGGGSRFELTLPARPPSDAEVQPEAPGLGRKITGRATLPSRTPAIDVGADP